MGKNAPQRTKARYFLSEKYKKFIKPDKVDDYIHIVFNRKIDCEWEKDMEWWQGSSISQHEQKTIKSSSGGTIRRAKRVAGVRR